jgi:hypothetical protein
MLPMQGRRSSTAANLRGSLENGRDYRLDCGTRLWVCSSVDRVPRLSLFEEREVNEVEYRLRDIARQLCVLESDPEMRAPLT